MKCLEYPFEKVQEDYPLISDKRVVYLDSATKTLPPLKIIEGIKQYYADVGVSPRRGAHHLSVLAERELEEARLKIARLINAKNENIIFTPSIPFSAATLISGYPWKRGDKILISEAEHNSILAPAFQARKRFGLSQEVVGLDHNLKLNIEDLENKIDGDCKILLATLTPMILGVKNPLKEAVKIAHEHDCYVISDITRAIIHQEIDFKKLECDALIFSSCIGIPSLEGISVICAKKELLEVIEPLTPGGGSIKEASYNGYKNNPLPDKLEAGLINMSSVISLKEAIAYIESIGLEKIRAYNLKLANTIYEELKSMKGVRLYGPREGELEAPIVSFNIEGFHSHDISIFLDETNKIITRSGMQCSYLLSYKINERGVVQVSPHYYNTPEHASTLVNTLNLIIGELS